MLLVAIAASGCFLDEIDKSVKANEFEAAHASTGATTPGEPPKPAATAAKPAAGAAGAPLTSWWETAKTLGAEESRADIVGCVLGGRLEYMERDDCLARGGSTQ